MRNKRFSVSRTWAVVACALASSVWIAGCKSTPDAGASAARPAVLPTQFAAADDAMLAMRVKSALAADPELKPLRSASRLFEEWCSCRGM